MNIGMFLRIAMEEFRACRSFAKDPSGSCEQTGYQGKAEDEQAVHQEAGVPERAELMAWTARGEYLDKRDEALAPQETAPYAVSPSDLDEAWRSLQGELSREGDGYSLASRPQRP